MATPYHPAADPTARYLSDAQIAALAGLHPSTITKARLAGAFGPWRSYGRAVRVPREAVEAWLASWPVIEPGQPRRRGRGGMGAALGRPVPADELQAIDPRELVARMRGRAG